MDRRFHRNSEKGSDVLLQNHPRFLEEYLDELLMPAADVVDEAQITIWNASTRVVQNGSACGLVRLEFESYQRFSFPKPWSGVFSDPRRH